MWFLVLQPRFGDFSICSWFKHTLRCPWHSKPEVMSAQIPINLSHMWRQAALALCVHSSSLRYDGLILLGVDSLTIDTEHREKTVQGGIRGVTPEAVSFVCTRDSRKCTYVDMWTNMWGFIIRSTLKSVWIYDVAFLAVVQWCVTQKTAHPLHKFTECNMLIRNLSEFSLGLLDRILSEGKQVLSREIWGIILELPQQL